MWQKIILVFLLVILLTFGFFYYVLRTKTKDVSEYKPFSTLIGNTLFLSQDVLLAQKRVVDQIESPYTFYDLSDRLPDAVKPIDTLKKGTPIQLHKAIIRRNGTSGMSSVLLLGEGIGNKTSERFSFEYEWGDFHFMVQEPYWTFPLAPWQTKPDTHHYLLPNL